MKSFSLIFLRFYVKLQDAYAAESNKLGTWELIGYVAPGAKSAGEAGETTNFKYYAGSSPAIDAFFANLLNTNPLLLTD